MSTYQPIALTVQMRNDEAMKYEAVTFDTQTVETNGFHFDGGLLGQLKQFRGGPTQVLITDVVAREILKHVITKTKGAKEALESAMVKAHEAGLVEAAAAPFRETPVDVQAIAKERLNSFLRSIGALPVRSDAVSARQLLDMYFAPAPPFKPSGKKKNEFPDAIALLSLEAWAKENGKRVLAVSGDTDWKAFADRSDHIDVVEELQAGLTLLQDNLDTAEAEGLRILSLIVSDQGGELASDLTERLSMEVSQLYLWGEADSSYHIEPDQVDLTFVSLVPIEPDLTIFEVVQFNDTTLAIELEAKVAVKAEASFSISIYDSIDKDYVSMGSAEAEQEVELDLRILITFERNVGGGAPQIVELELINPPDSIDFGHVEPDYGEPDYDYEDSFLKRQKQIAVSKPTLSRKRPSNVRASTAGRVQTYRARLPLALVRTPPLASISSTTRLGARESLQ